MGFWSKLADMILGYDIITVDKATELVTKAISKCDVDGNGYLNAREVISTIKTTLKYYFKGYYD